LFYTVSLFIDRKNTAAKSKVIKLQKMIKNTLKKSSQKREVAAVPPAGRDGPQAQVPAQPVLLASSIPALAALASSMVR